jgi:hypothetical protein
MTTAKRLIVVGAGILGMASLAALASAQQAQQGQDAVPRPAADLVKEIDQILAKHWNDAGVKPAAQADDSEFLRRVYLDLTGSIPSVAEARAFLKDTRADKRQRLIEQLLGSPRHVTHAANMWRALLIPEANNNFLVKLQQNNFQAWLQRRLTTSDSIDILVRDLLTAPVGNGGYNPFDLTGGGPPSAVAFYSAKEFKPESLAASTARVFLGVSVECAQCHNHPFNDWKKEQFWSFAAFYSGMRSQQQMDFLVPGKEEAEQKEIKMPGTDKIVKARFLDDVEPQWQPKATSRATLAEWVTSPANPYFSRAMVNRTWAYLFGTGLVEPVDDMVGPQSGGKHGELLDLLSREFVAHKFDMKFLIRTLVSTQAYQLTSATNSTTRKAEGQDDVLFDRMPLRGLSGEQLFDSVAMATGYRDASGADDLLTVLTGGGGSARSQFLSKFAQTGKATQSQTSILQALALMNGKVVADATSLERSETLSALLDAPFLSTSGRIEALYLATLSRMPTAKEVERLTRFVDDAVRRNEGEAGRDRAYSNALADVFWVLLNSSEFGINH